MTSIADMKVTWETILDGGQIEEDVIHFWDDGIEWWYRILDASRLEEALEIAFKAVRDWYDVEGHPDFEDLCIGDVADIYLEDAGIEYEYLGGNYYDEA